MLALLLVAVLTAADPISSALDAAREQLARHDDVAARKTIERALPLAASEPKQLALLYLVLGLAWADGAYETEAIEAFTTALKLDRRLVLPESSPKVVDWWRRAGGTVPEAPVDEPEPPVEASDVPAAPPQPVVVPPVVAPPVARATPALAPPPAVTAAPLWSARLGAWWPLPAALAAVTAGVGIVTWKMSHDRWVELASGTRPLLPAEAEGLRASGKSLQAATATLIGASALFVAAALILVIFSKSG